MAWGGPKRIHRMIKRKWQAKSRPDKNLIFEGKCKERERVIKLHYMYVLKCK